MFQAWQVEAVREQFKVLHSLESIQKDLNTGNIGVVIKEVDTIIQKHLRLRDKSKCQQTRHISAEIIKASNGKVKFGFIVIVTDQRVNGLLSKIPIFVIQCGQENVFIDMSCFSFTSWHLFLQEHYGKVLPPGNFCFPVNGQYLDGKRLKIDFATNLPLSIGRCLWRLSVTGLTIAAFTASFFVNIKPKIDAVTKILEHIAENHLDSVNVSFEREHVIILRLFLDWKERKITWQDASSLINTSLRRIFEYYDRDMNAITSQIQYSFRNILGYLKKKLPSVFKRQSVPLRLLGHINNNDKCLIGPGDMNGLRQSDVSTSQIFENCVNERIFHQSGKENSQYEPIDLTPCNKALVCMTSDFVQRTHQKNLSQNECSNLYLILKEMVVDDSNERLKLYHKCRVAAHNSGSGININEYNQRLGITGDPETHFFMEAINHVNQSPVIQYLVTSKCKELVIEEPVQLIQCSKMTNNEKLGIYKFIGMENGLIPPRKFLKPLKEIFCADGDNELFDEDKLVMREDTGGSQCASHIVLISNKLNVFIRQHLTNEGISQGFLVVIEEDE